MAKSKRGAMSGRRTFFKRGPWYDRLSGVDQWSTLTICKHSKRVPVLHALFQEAAVKIGKERCREIIAENNFGVDDFDKQRLNILAFLAGTARFGFVGVLQVFKHSTPNFTFILTPTSPELFFAAQLLLRQSAVQFGHGPVWAVGQS